MLLITLYSIKCHRIRHLGPSGPTLSQQGHVQAALGDLQGDPTASLTTCARAQPPAQHGQAS